MDHGQLMWLDIETTGLDDIRNVILEIGFVVTDLDLNILDSISVVLWHDYYQEHFDNCDPFVKAMHDKSGLFVECAEKGITLDAAGKALSGWLSEWKVDPTQDPVCGSSVHFDRGFMSEHLPDIDAMFFYRDIDISSIKELCRRYNPDLFARLDETTTPKKLHRVLPDIQDTLGEAQFYLDNFLFI